MPPDILVGDNRIEDPQDSQSCHLGNLNDYVQISGRARCCS